MIIWTNIFPILLVCTWPLTDCARILAVFPFWAKSHHLVIQPVLRTLADAGHQLVVYSPFPLDTPHHNYSDVTLDLTLTEEEIIEDVLLFMDEPQYKCLEAIVPIPDMVFHHFFDDDRIKQLIRSDQKFDLVMTESFFGQEFTLIFGRVFKAPVICVQTFFTNSVVSVNMGNALSLAYIPDSCFSYSTSMSLGQRAVNALNVLRGVYLYYRQHLPYVDHLLRGRFPDSPPVREMIDNVALVFVNDHLTADYARPRTPNMIPVGGIHLGTPKALPQDIKAFMDGAKDGVILFSLGTLVPDERRPQEYFHTLVNVFRRLPQRVLWKTRKQNIEDLPPNVMTLKWAPQYDILSHPSCVLFLTHGGLGSQIEAVVSAVPVVSIPYFFDQYRNAEFYRSRGVGERLFPDELTEQSLTAAIHTVLADPKYKENMKKLSEVYKDRPMSPQQSVVFWTEYVLRNGAQHLRPASTALTWYQLALVDLLAVVLVAAASVAVVIYLIISRVIVRVRMSRQSRLSKKSN